MQHDVVNPCFIDW